MSRLVQGLLSVSATFFVVSAVTWPATGDVPVAACSDTPVECSKVAFEAGVAASEKGDWPTAVQRFREAYALRAHPVIAFNLAVAEAKTGLFVEAVQHLDSVLQDPSSPKPIVKKARSERDLAAKSISVIVIDSGSTQGATVFLDGRKLEGSAPRAEANPGDHLVRIEIPGSTPIDRTVRLLAGETLRVTIDRSREFVVATQPAAVDAGADQGAEAPVSSHGSLSPTWFYVGLGATAVVGGVTLWSGLNTMTAVRDYENDLPTLSQQEINRRVSEGHDKELRTNILLGTTAALAVGTAALGIFFVRWGPQKQSSAALFPATQGVQVSGTF